MAQPPSKTSSYQHRSTTRIENSWLNLQYHQNGTIKKPSDLEEELKYPPQIDERILNRIHGSMMGMALGDAIGARAEFRPQSYLEHKPMKTLRGGGTWGLEKGQFTDDTSMALCLANSLILCRDLIPYDQLVRYKWWYRHGYMSSTGKCFDIGAATKKSLEKFERRQAKFAEEHGIALEEMDNLSNPKIFSKFNVYCSEEGVAGNGALMRLAPVPLFFYHHPEYAVLFSGISGEITHGDQSSIDACRYYGALIVAALLGEKKEELLSENFYVKHRTWFRDEPLHPNIMTIAQGSYKKEGGHKAGIRGKGYVVQSLEAALWAFWSDGNSFETGVLAAVNLGDDTDTTAAIYGQLAGAFYGYENLPQRWRDAMYANQFIFCLSRWIVYEGERWRPENSLAFTKDSSISQEKPKTTTNHDNEQNRTFNVYPTASQLNFKKHPKTSSEANRGSEYIAQTAVQSKTCTNKDKAPKSQTNVTQFKGKPEAMHRDYSLNTNASTNGTHSPNQHNLNTYSTSTSTNISPPISTDIDLKAHEYFYDRLKSVGKAYEPYVDNFKTHRIDPNQLIYNANDKTLIKYGVENKEHRETILRFIRDWPKNLIK